MEDDDEEEDRDEDEEGDEEREARWGGVRGGLMLIDHIGFIVYITLNWSCLLDSVDVISYL